MPCQAWRGRDLRSLHGGTVVYILVGHYKGRDEGWAVLERRGGFLLLVLLLLLFTFGVENELRASLLLSPSLSTRAGQRLPFGVSRTGKP